MEQHQKLLDEYEFKTQSHCTTYTSWNVKPRHGPVAFKKLIQDVEAYKEQVIKLRNEKENIPHVGGDAYFWNCYTDMEIYSNCLRQTIMEKHQVEYDILLISEMSIWTDYDDPYNSKIKIEYQHEGKKYSYHID